MDSEKLKLRKYQDDLNVSGSGIIIMGAWSVVRVLIELFIGTKGASLLENDRTKDKVIGIAMVVVIVAILSFIIMKVHLYIGLNASRAAKGRAHKEGYFIAAIITFILSVASMYFYKSAFQNLENIDTTIASILVDLVSIYLLFTIISATIKIKKIKDT